MKKIDLAYSAGIFDGEGCITFQRSKSHKQSVMVQLTNTNEWIVHQFKFWFGGSVTCFQHGGGVKNWKPCWRWQGHGETGIRFIKLVLPYLRLKKPQADLVIAFQELKRKKDMTDVLEEANKIRLSHLNKRGVR